MPKVRIYVYYQYEKIDQLISEITDKGLADASFIQDCLHNIEITTKEHLRLEMYVEGRLVTTTNKKEKKMKIRSFVMSTRLGEKWHKVTYASNNKAICSPSLNLVYSTMEVIVPDQKICKKCRQIAKNMK